MRSFLCLVLVVGLSACGLIYKLPTRQGNVLDQKELDKIELGMSRQQVQILLGTPIAASSMRDDRWDYLAYYKNPRGKAFSRTVTLYWQGDTLARMEGNKAAGDAKATAPDFEQIEKEEKKAATEEERAAEPTDSGVVIKQKKKQ